MAEKLKYDEKKVQESLRSLPSDAILEVHGTYSYGDVLNKIDGELLKKVIESDRKNKRPEKCIKKVPHYRFQLNDVTVPLTGKNGAPANAFEALVNQRVDRWEKDGEARSNLKEELRNNFAIGYRSGDKVIAINRKNLEGKRFAYGQGMTITYELYEYDGQLLVGIANVIFDERPQLYVAENAAARLGAKASQGWATEVDNFDDAPVTKAPANDSPVEQNEAASTEGESNDWTQDTSW